MELNRINIAIKASFIFLLALMFASCEYMEIVNCSECYSEPPSETYIYVKINDKYTNHESVEIKIFDGDYEDGILHYSFYLRSSSDTPIMLSIDKKYTFTATFNVDGKSYIVFDNVSPTIEYSSNGCESPCYYIKDDQVNLKLKYTE